MREYLLGLATLPALAAVAWIVIQIHYSITHWHRGPCGICGRMLPWGPRWLIGRAHSRIRHGLALTMRGRLRKRQWHGIAWWYAEKHGARRGEWEAATAPYRAEFRRRQAERARAVPVDRVLGTSND